MQHHTTDVIEVIRIACKYIIKRAFKLFDNDTRLYSLQQLVTNLRLTSKDLNYSICDELSLEIMHRWMTGRDRCARVTKRIEKLLQKCDYNGLFRFMDAVAKVFSKRESVRLLSSFLITITQHHKHVLKEYMDFFTSRELHMTMKEYFSVERSFPFPGFTPQQVEKSLQIANENGWIEESMIIFAHFTTNYFFKLDEMQAHHVRLAMGAEHRKLNFSANLANRINNLSRHRGCILNYSVFYPNNWLSLYLEAEQITTTDLSKVLHSVNYNKAREILGQSSPSTSYCTVISFSGSRLIKYHCRRDDSRQQIQKSQYIPNSTRIFTALPPAPENCQTTYLYYFYCAVVDNDLETAKQLQLKHNIHIGTIMDAGVSPLLDYLTYADSVQQETVDYLVDYFGGIGDCLHSWNRELTDKVWTIIKNLIDKGAIIYTMSIWEPYFTEKAPQTIEEFQRIVDVTDRWIYESAISFLFQKLYEPYLRIHSQTKILLLLAWRYDSTCHLSKLPKELLKVIIEFVDEPPLFFQYPRMIMKILTTSVRISCPSEVLERTGEIARFVRDHINKFLEPWFTLSNYESERAVKRDAKYLREIMTLQRKAPNTYPPAKVYRYFCKHETDEKCLQAFLKYLVNYNPRFLLLRYPFLEYATVAKNISFLHEFYKTPGHIELLPKEDVYASIAPKRKNKMSFEEALALVNQVRSQYLATAAVNILDKTM